MTIFFCNNINTFQYCYDVVFLFLRFLQNIILEANSNIIQFYMQKNQYKPILTKIQILQIKKSFSLKKSQLFSRFYVVYWKLKNLASTTIYYNDEDIISSNARKLALVFELAQMCLLSYIILKMYLLSYIILTMYLLSYIILKMYLSSYII